MLKPVASLAVVAFCAGLAMAPVPAGAQDLQSLIDRIERLERDIRTLNVQLARGAASAATEQAADGAASLASGGIETTPAGVAHLDARITSLENDLRNVTGSVEEVGFQVSQLASRIDALIGDVDFRLSELERRSGGIAANGGLTAQAPAGDGLLPLQEGASTQPVTPQVQEGTGVLGSITEEQLSQIGEPSAVAPTTTVSGGISGQELAAPEPSVTASETGGAAAGAEMAALSPQDQYAQAFALLRQAKFEDAATELQAFVDQYPDHELTSNARYWLGETYYVRSEFVRAAEVFFEAYRLAPTGPKAPDTLLKLGMSLGNLDKKAEACAAFAKLVQEFPQPPAAIVTKLDRERARNGCQSGG